MNSTDEQIQNLKAHMDCESSTIRDFFAQMLRINAVNPRMGGPGEEERDTSFDLEKAEKGGRCERREPCRLNMAIAA